MNVTCKLISMVTPERLIAELNDRGYRVTSRKLRDWRAKGLLPPLTGRGRGRGLGISRCWPNKAIFGQAMAAYELLEISGRAEVALLGIWLWGYEAEVERVRQAWLASLNRTKIGLCGMGSTEDEIEDVLHDLSCRISKAMKSDVQIDLANLQPLLSEILNACFNGGGEVAIDDEVRTTFKAVVFLDLQKTDLSKLLHYVRMNLGIDPMMKLISEATNQELLDAHKRWRNIIQVIDRMSCSMNVSGDRSELVETGRKLAFIFGGYSVFVLLHLARQGYGRVIDENLDAFASINIASYRRSCVSIR